MLEAPLFIVIVIALVIGWLIGRVSQKKSQALAVDSLPTSYMQSLALMINEQPDEAIDKLISGFEVNEVSFDTHIALGNVSRKRGELERAIKIHQNLLSRPNLGRKHHDVAHFELAKDYLQAGLLDRAEVLLKDLLEKNTGKHRQAQLLLISLYEDESEWQQAIDVAQDLLPKRLLRPRTEAEQKIAIRIAHFYCQLAEQALNNKDYTRAGHLVDKTLAHDKNSLRGVYIKAQLGAAKGDNTLVLKLLPQILRSDSKLLFEALWLIDKATETWPKERAINYIEALYQDTHSAQVLERLLGFVSDEKAAVFIEQHLQQKPTLKAISMWLTNSDTLNDVSDDKRNILFSGLKKLQSDSKRYQCKSCGFKGMHFFWHCPTCKEWDTIEILRGEKSD